MRQIESLRGAIRLAISENVLPRDTNVDQLVLTSLSMSVLQRFHEGYYGNVLNENIAKASGLRQENRDEYDRQLMENAKHVRDLRGIAGNMRVLEALTSTDLALGLAWTRGDAANTRDFRPAFKTDLLSPEFTTRRTVDGLNRVESRNGVRLADTFLRRRAEASNLAYTSFSTDESYYNVEGYELGLNFTNEMKMRDTFGQLQDAAREMGVAAARTRALAVLDAVIRKAPRLVLPAAALGPNVDNLQAVVSYMADQMILGVPASQTMTDIFVSGAWQTVANTALTTPVISTGAGTMVIVPNPIYNGATVHNEQILTLAQWAQDYPGLDRKSWFAVDRDGQPFEFATLRGWEAGPQTLVEVPDTVDIDLGSMDNQLFRIKVVDYAGADVANPAAVLFVPGTPNAPLIWTP